MAYKNSSQQLQLEVSELEKKVANLTSSLEESQANANVINNPDGEGIIYQIFTLVDLSV